MLSMDNILKMAGVNKEQLNQLMTLQSMLNKLPEDEKQRVVGNFIKELQDAIKKQESK